MEKKALAAHAAAGAGAIVLLALVFAQSVQLHTLEQKVEFIRWQQTEYSSQSNQSFDALKERIDQSASLFDTLETSLHYRSEGLVLTISALPKAMRLGDALFLALGGQEPIDLPFSPNTYRAEIKVPLVETLTPVLLLVSDDGVTQQETMKPISIGIALSIPCSGGWYSRIDPSTDKTVLTVALTPTEAVPATRLTGLTPTVTVIEQMGEVFGTVEGVEVPKTLNPNTVCYEFDLSAYEKTVGDFYVRFVLDTEGGITFLHNVASMRNGPNGGGSYDITDGMVGPFNLSPANN